MALDLTSPSDRRELAARLQQHAVHIARFVGTLQSDTAAQIAGSNMLQASVTAVQVARRFVFEPSTERGDAIIDALEAQEAWFDVVAGADLSMPSVMTPHRERLLDLLADASATNT